MERFWLTMLCVAFFALCAWGMWRGWRRQAREQSVRFPPFPTVPDDLGDPVLPEAGGHYVCTTRAGHWQERIVTRGTGVRTSGTLRLYRDGVEVHRPGAPSFWIPRADIVGADTARAMAGKVMGTEALLVITWRLGESVLDTGFKADDLDVYPAWTAALGKTEEARHGSGDD